MLGCGGVGASFTFCFFKTGIFFNYIKVKGQEPDPPFLPRVLRVYVIADRLLPRTRFYDGFHQNPFKSAVKLVLILLNPCWQMLN